MAWQAFGSLAAGNQNLSLFDTLTAQIAKTVIVPCTAAGTNVITLSGTPNAPAIPSYSDLVTFSFLAAATSTGTVTAGFTGLATLNVYLADGATVAAAGNIKSGQLYTLTYSLALNSGAGGFYLGQISVPVGVASGMQLIQKISASNSADIEFVNGIGASYGTYLLSIQDMIPVTNATSLLLQISTDGGGTWKAGASDYSYANMSQTDNSGAPAGAGATTTSIQICLGVSNSATRGLGAIINFWKPSGTLRNKMFMWDAAFQPDTFTIRRQAGGGGYVGSQVAINGVRLIMSAGNISAGDFSLYGMPNA